MRAFIYYLITYVALSFYGGEVCPFLESLGFFQLSVNLAFFIFPAFLLRSVAIDPYLKRYPLTEQSQRLFFFELIFFLALGLALTVYNMIVYDFPVGSGLKIVLGTATMGFFSSLDLVLERERRIINELKGSTQPAQLGEGFFSLPKKFTMIATVTAIFSSAILLLLVIKDFNWLANNVEVKGIASAKRSVIIEIVFVIAVLFSLGTNLIISYSKNLQLYFQSETRVLELVTEGNLDSYVPVLSNDEFGLIASHTNQMIDGLKEKNKIKNMFGKVVSPQVAERLYAQSGDEIKMGGSRQDMVILFSDIRNFTTMTEQSAPEELIERLNAYFSIMVEIINRNHGMVDKFIGDGILAVFGFDSIHNAVNHAVLAALEMEAALKASDNELVRTLEIGVGIHRGEVIAGTIGSPDRLEFTFIGDTVNTASRLESMTKELNASLIVSREIYDELDLQLKTAPWADLGPQTLKGKAEPVSTMGIRKS